jgi:hypothetical protein
MVEQIILNKKSYNILYIVLGIISFIFIGFALYFLIIKKKPYTCSPENCRLGTCVNNVCTKASDKSPMFGLALETNTTNIQIIDLSKLKGKITCFWNWKNILTDEQLLAQYNWTKDLNIQFLPMLWGSNNPVDLPDNYNYVMLSNEPDMIGGCKDPNVTPCGGSNPATSSGYWISNGDYGCFSSNMTTSNQKCEPKTIINIPPKNTFTYLIENFITQCGRLKQGTIVVSPAMSQNATGDCDAYQTEFNGDLPVSHTPNTCSGKGCVCHGWLSLLKAAALNGNNDRHKKWWNDTLKIISIHAYYKYSHHVKNKILQYMDEFKDDIAKGKEIWLTEVAYVSEKDDDAHIPEYIKESAEFAKTLLYENSIYNKIPACNDVTFISDAKRDLPGLLTTTPFLFNGKIASWFDHGLTCVTWFCVEIWANFLTGCNGVNPTNSKLISSYPFESDHTTPNELFYSLFPS